MVSCDIGYLNFIHCRWIAYNSFDDIDRRIYYLKNKIRELWCFFIHSIALSLKTKANFFGSTDALWMRRKLSRGRVVAPLGSNAEMTTLSEWLQWRSELPEQKRWTKSIWKLWSWIASNSRWLRCLRGERSSRKQPLLSDLRKPRVAKVGHCIRRRHRDCVTVCWSLTRSTCSSRLVNRVRWK